MKTYIVRLILKHMIPASVMMVIIAVASVSLAAESQSTADVNTAWSSSWKLGLGTESWQSENSRTDLVAFSGLLKTDKVWNDFLDFTSEVMLKTRSGQREGTNENGVTPQSLYIFEASLGIGKAKALQARLGALNPHAIHSPILLEGLAIPGGRLTQAFPSEHQTFSIYTEAYAPQSHQVRAAGGEKGSFPAFFAGGVNQKYKWSNRFDSSWRAGAFQFQGLNTSVQNTSTLLGNTSTPGPTNDLALLKYDYVGFEVGQTHNFLIAPKFLGTISADFIKNQEAPEGQNSAYRGEFDLTSVVMPKYHLVTEVEAFRIEPDAVLAAFSNSDYFGANRNGYRIGISLLMKKEKLKVTGSMIESQTIVERPPQVKEQFYFLKMSTTYEKL
ncbi:MAG: hypothetical protein V4736_02700 [Bdellovibrionota bacterium]